MNHAPLGAMAGAAVLAVVLAATLPTTTRSYWKVPLDTLAAGHPKHTHAAIVGVVSYCRIEDDGDKHIRLRSTGTDTTRFIVAEIIPRIPQQCPLKGDTIIVAGITREDPEHHWWEIHPVEFWTRTTP